MPQLASINWTITRSKPCCNLLVITAHYCQQSTSSSPFKSQTVFVVSVLIDIYYSFVNFLYPIVFEHSLTLLLHWIWLFANYDECAFPVTAARIRNCVLCTNCVQYLVLCTKYVAHLRIRWLFQQSPETHSSKESCVSCVAVKWLSLVIICNVISCYVA